MEHEIMAHSPAYDDLDAFLKRCSRQELLDAFSAPWINTIIPGLDALQGCDQGKRDHCEGDVAVHTALVFENLALAAKRRLDREPSFVEKLSVLVHDLKKPATRRDLGDGRVIFPGHEEAAGLEILTLSPRLGLSLDERERLRFVVEQHGRAHRWPRIAEEQRGAMLRSPFRESLALLQEADAISCVRPDGTHLPIYWGEIVG